MRKYPLLLIMLAAISSGFDLNGQTLFVSTSMTHPRGPELFELSYESGTEVMAGIMGFRNKRLFFSIGIGYISMSHDSKRLLEGVDVDVRVEEILGGDFSYMSLQAEVGYIFIQRTKWLNPYLSGSLAFGPYEEDAINTFPGTKFEVLSSGRQSLRSKAGLGVQSWIIRDRIGISIAYEHAIIHATRNRGDLRFSVFRWQLMIW